MSDKCVLSSSCCGCSLRSGSLAIGIISLVFGIINSIYSIYEVANGIKQGWVQLIINILSVIMAIILIIGVRKERRSYVMGWVWVTAIVIAINIILGILAIILSLNIVLGIIYFIVMGVAVYCLLVVRSFALSLGSSPTMA
nr:uncharacterized protein LOC128687365 [Cherax quadricarinatus]